MNTAPTTYAIRVHGHLDDHWSAWLGEPDMTRENDGTTTITASIADQTQLHGVLAGLRDIGAVITELQTTPAPVPACPSVLERPLPTERLTLRAATADDAEATWKYHQLESVNEWLTGWPADLDGYRKLFSEPARLASTVIVTLGHGAAAPIIGDFMLRREDAWAQLEVADQAHNMQAKVGWVLDPAHTGHGYATEAVRELLRYCFQDLGVRRITANCFLDNDPSWHLMQRVGMRRELHAVRDSLHRSGRWLDTVGYAILKEEWWPTWINRRATILRDSTRRSELTARHADDSDRLRAPSRTTSEGAGDDYRAWVNAGVAEQPSSSGSSPNCEVVATSACSPPWPTAAEICKFTTGGLRDPVRHDRPSGPQIGKQVRPRQGLPGCRPRQYLQPRRALRRRKRVRVRSRSGPRRPRTVVEYDDEPAPSACI